MSSPPPARTSGVYPKTAMDMDLSARKLDKMIEEATVDCYDELEQASGLYMMIEDNLAVPFETQVLGVEVSVVGVEMDNIGSLKAVCERTYFLGHSDAEVERLALQNAFYRNTTESFLRRAGLT